MPTTIKPRPILTIAASLATSLALIPAVSHAASPAVPVRPFVDCVAFNGDTANPVYTAYFGYENTGPVTFSFDPASGENSLFPGANDVGQTRSFFPGNYPRVFSTTFDGHFISAIDWELNGQTVAASTSSPTCSSGLTTPASDVGTTSASLNGVVTPEGQDDTYTFEYGTSSAFGTSTPTQDAGAGTQPQLVQTSLTGLAPSTKYFFRLNTTTASTGTTHGQTQSFTTPASSAPASTPLALGSTSLANATFGAHYSQTLAASGGTPPYTWSVTGGTLPPGLSLTNSTGVISGTPTTAGTSHFTIKVTDATTPDPRTASQPLSITVDRAASGTHVISFPNPTVAGWPVTYTAVVSPDAPGVAAPSGTVAFLDNGAPAHCTGGSPALSPTGLATCTLRYRDPGTHSIVARYGGDAHYAGSDSVALSETVRHTGHHRHPR